MLLEFELELELEFELELLLEFELDPRRQRSSLRSRRSHRQSSLLELEFELELELLFELELLLELELEFELLLERDWYWASLEAGEAVSAEERSTAIAVVAAPPAASRPAAVKTAALRLDMSKLRKKRPPCLDQVAVAALRCWTGCRRRERGKRKPPVEASTGGSVTTLIDRGAEK